VQVHDPNGTALGELPAVVLRPHGEAGAPPPRRIDAVRRAPDGTFVVAFHGIATRNDAEALRGMLVLAARADLRPPGAGEWYAADLVGLQAVAPDGRPLGRVRDVYANGAQEVLVVAAAGGDVDVPFVDAHVGEVDLDAGRLVIVDIDALRIAPGPGSPEP
jgi:16S rRNA processing protein RimM